MAELVLSRAQRNEIFAMIQANNLDPAEFAWSSVLVDKRTVDVLEHRPTGGWFKASQSTHQAGFWLEWWPYQGERYDHAGDWESARRTAWQWIEAIRQDYEAPDLWGELAKAKTIPGADRPEYLEQFSQAELKLLDAGLTDIERYVTTTQPLDSDKKADVKRRFDYLREAAAVGARKIDWLNIFVGQMVGMVTEGLLDAKVYGPLMAHAGTALNAVFQFGLKLLGG